MTLGEDCWPLIEEYSHCQTVTGYGRRWQGHREYLQGKQWLKRNLTLPAAFHVWSLLTAPSQLESRVEGMQKAEMGLLN